MSGLDKILYFTRERLLSTDLNEQERISARGVLDALQWMVTWSAGNQDNESITGSTFQAGVVLGGLRVDPGTGGVVVNPGMIVQPWSGGGSAPASDESNTVMGIQRELVDLPIAVPGADTWYLVQARCTTAVTTATREEWDPGTETFSSVVVGRKVENVLELDVKAGTSTNIPLPDAGWLPLSGVKRLATGEEPTINFMVDLRPMYEQELVPVQQSLLGHRTSSAKDCNLFTDHYQGNEATAPSVNVGFRFETNTDRGRMFAQTNTAPLLVNIGSTPFMDPSTVFAADTWYYLYLCKWGAPGLGYTGPRQAYADVVNQGLLVISHVPPSVQGSDLMPAGVSLPAPFSLGTVRIGVCVGMLQRTTANDGFQGQIMVNNCVTHIAFGGPTSIGGNSPQSFAAGAIPVNARTLTLDVRSTGVPAPSGVSVFRSGTFLAGELMASAEIGVQDDSHLVTVPLVGVTTTAMNIRRGGGTDPVNAAVKGMEI